MPLSAAFFNVCRIFAYFLGGLPLSVPRRWTLQQTLQLTWRRVIAPRRGCAQVPILRRKHAVAESFSLPADKVGPCPRCCYECGLGTGAGLRGGLWLYSASRRCRNGATSR